MRSDPRVRQRLFLHARGMPRLEPLTYVWCEADQGSSPRLWAIVTHLIACRAT